MNPDGSAQGCRQESSLGHTNGRAFIIPFNTHGLGVSSVDTWQLHMAIFAVSQGLVEELGVVQKLAVFYKTT